MVVDFQPVVQVHLVEIGRYELVVRQNSDLA